MRGRIETTRTNALRYNRKRKRDERVETAQNDERYDETNYTIFVMVEGNPTQLPLATMQGYDENGYYGTGFDLYVSPAKTEEATNA